MIAPGAVHAARLFIRRNDNVERIERIMRPHSRQKSLNRFGARAVSTAVLIIDRCPSHP